MGRFGLAFFVLALAVSLVAAMEVETKAAAGDESAIDLSSGDRAPAGERLVGNAIPRKRYPGGVDEDDVQVQAVLPTASRGLEAAEVDLNPAPVAKPTPEAHGD